MIEPGNRLIASTLMPISILWKDFADRHEYTSPNVPMNITPEAVMDLMTKINHYVYDAYQSIGMTQQEWDELYNEVMPLVGKGVLNEQSNNVDGVARVWKDNVGEDASGKGRNNPNQQGRPKSNDAQQPPFGEEGEADIESEGQSDDPSPALRP